MIPLFMTQIKEASANIQKSKGEASQLQIKQRILQSVLNESKDELDQDLAIVTALVPDTEDYFSMIYSLEQLSKSTGFIINNYTVNLSKSNGNKLSLTVAGEGNSQSFMELLRNYNFAGGRLITAEKIGIDPAVSSGISLDLNFYSKTATIENDDKLNYQASIDQLKDLRSKVKFSIVDKPAPQQPTEPESTDYPTKTSLF